DKFFSIIAHDLKSPFNSMLGFSELLMKRFDKYDIQHQKKFISNIYYSIHNTYKLLENLLLWSRTQRGIIDFNPEPENLYLILVEIIELLSQSATNKSINIKNEISEDIFVKADKNMLSSILRNLISNAIKFTHKGGEIIIEAQLRNDKNKQDFIEISVCDNGIGIKSEIKSKLFSISENISTKGTKNESGTGLGLILCKEFIEKHGGKIGAESELGKSSIFHFTIPLQ
ncbi:MAG: HAMP domain-containing histidine kinase, partial [Bacteroidales bacterium]|nr:HAMP domain-containing histidine kinase [Bacteroidales bacterium]